MQNTGKTPAETAVSTMPQYLVDRFENEWRQMRATAAETPKAATVDKR